MTTTRRHYVTTAPTKAQLARRALVEAPFPPIDLTTRYAGKSWAGVLIRFSDQFMNGRVHASSMGEELSIPTELTWWE